MLDDSVLKIDGCELNHHHLLWYRNAWRKGYASRLRNHPYLILFIPDAPLHRVIHELMDSIPVPNDRLCRSAFRTLNEAIRNRVVDYSDDPPELRLQFLIDCWHNRANPTTDALAREQELFLAYEDGLLPRVYAQYAVGEVVKKNVLALASSVAVESDSLTSANSLSGMSSRNDDARDTALEFPLSLRSTHGTL